MVGIDRRLIVNDVINTATFTTAGTVHADNRIGRGFIHPEKPVLKIDNWNGGIIGHLAIDESFIQNVKETGAARGTDGGRLQIRRFQRVVRCAC